MPELATTAFRRACFLLPQAGPVPEEEEEPLLAALNSLDAARKVLAADADDAALFQQGLQKVIDAAESSPVLRGAAVGVMAGNGWLAHDALLRHLEGHLASACDEGTAGMKFLRGLLAGYRGLLWQAPEIITGLTAVLQGWDEEHFLQQLPLLRLTFASLTPRECDRVAHVLSEYLGVTPFTPQVSYNVSAEEYLHGAEVDNRVAAMLREEVGDEFLTGLT